MCAHRFLLSGADVISTATYQASVEGFIHHLNVSSEGAKELIMSGVQLAKEAVETFVSGANPNTAGLRNLHKDFFFWMISETLNQEHVTGVQRFSTELKEFTIFLFVFVDR